LGKKRDEWGKRIDEELGIWSKESLNSVELP
jgi:hypothetical protein